MDLNTDTGESLLQLEIRKCQQAFAMSSHDEPEEFEDIQFFHRIPPVALSSFKAGGSSGGFMSTAPPSYPDGEESCQESESSYMFPENVMEYGEPQFFPGNCVGYLETILEETDEDCEEEEGSSGRHWWTPDSDTDTESVIRLEPTNPPAKATMDHSDKCLFTDFLQKGSSGLPGPVLTESLSSPSSPPLRSTNPFELEELYLFDQLDLAFEETLMKPRRRTGFAFEAELHLPPFQEPQLPAETNNNENDESVQPFPVTLPDDPPHSPEGQGLEEDEEPAVVNEEDFFCSSSSHSSSSSEEDRLGLSETEETSEDSTTGSDEEKKSGIVLAEFSLNPFQFDGGGGGGAEIYTNSAANAAHRRSYEAPSKIRSFRSYDSLNSLLGTELLFSPPESFIPPAAATTFQEIAETGGLDEDGRRAGSSGGGSRSSSTEDKVTASRKNSGEVSSENLSEDSGIHDLLHGGPAAHEQEVADFQLPKPEFALNPFVYSSASEENSMMSSSTNCFSSDIFEVRGESESSSEKVVECWEREEDEHSITTTTYIITTSQKRERISTSSIQVPTVNNGEVVESGPMSTLGSSSPTTTRRRGVDEEEIKDCDRDLDELTQLISPSTTSSPPPPLTKGAAERNISPRGDEQVHPSIHPPDQDEEKEDSARGPDADSNPTKEDPLSVNLSAQQPNPINPSSKTILSSSHFGPEKEPYQSLEEQEQEDSGGDYVTLVVLGRGEEKGGWSGGEPSVRVSSLTGVDVTLPAPAEFLEQEATRMQVDPGSPVPIKTYGGVSNNDVAVYLVTSGGCRTPSPTVLIPPHGQGLLEGALEPGSATGSLTKTKTVHFSPVVSEISWRESYAEPSEGDIDASEPSSPGHNAQGHNEHEGLGLDAPGQQGPIEKVHVHSQILSEPLPMVIPRSEKERLMALEPDDLEPPGCPGRLAMSTVPDLLSQCEPSPGHGSSGDEVDAAGNGPYYYQQQIFPAMFVASAKEAAEANQVNLKKNGKKATYVAPPVVPPSPAAVVAAPPPKPPKGKRSDKENEVEPATPAGGGDKAGKDGGKSKPGFFQRLSKIRLSGKSQPKAPKTKIYPKEIEPSPVGKGAPLGPILKKGPTPLVLQNKSPGTPPLQNGATAPPQPKEHDECSEAFENILEEIAGLNTILQRQQFPQQGQGSLSSSSGKRSFAERKQFLINPEEAVVLGQVSALDTKLSQFREEASRTRDHISRSHPDLETMQGMTARQVRPSSPGGLQQDVSPSPGSPGTGAPGSAESRKTEREWYRLLRSAAEKYYHGGRPGSVEGTHKTGIVETDLDTGTSRELLDAELVILDELDLTLGSPPPLPATLPPTASATTNGHGGAKAQSLTNLTTGLKLLIAPSSQGIDDDGEERAKSLEFLLDEEQKSAASPPENRLREDNRQVSEHELRIQRSLQKINVPDWYRRHSYRSKSVERDRDRSAELRKDTPLVTPNGSTPLQLLKRTDYGSAGGLAGGWAGLSAYRTPSLSSLQNGGLTTGSLNRSNFVRGKPVTMSATRSSRESLLSPTSTASQSPSAFERCSFTYGMPLTLTRYGKGRLSSTSGTSPGSGASPSSTPGQNAPLSAYVKQPYLGWRSTERLNNSGTATSTGTGLKLSAYRPPAERLAADMLTRQKKSPARPTGSERPPLPKAPSRNASEKSAKTMSLPPPATETEVPVATVHETARNPSPTIHDSIREVTDAINEFVSHGSEGMPKPQPRGRHVKKQALWFESSFVGKKTQTQ